MNSIKNIFTSFFFFVIISFSSFGQTFSEQEKKLASLLDSIKYGSHLEVKNTANQNFTKELQYTLSLNNAFHYPFSNLKMGIFTSPDKQIRIFNWMLIKDKREYDYFAVIQFFNPKTKQYQTVTLDNTIDEIFEPEQSILDSSQWFGALYSDLIEVSYQNKTYYTLLGWNGNDPAVNRSVIDVINIKPNGEISSGAPIFQMGKELKKRLVFNFSKRASMILRYDNQECIEVTTNKKGVKKEKIIPAKMIVMDHLMPEQSHLKGHFEYYIPAGDIYDGLLFKNGKWILKADILVKNKPQKK